MKKLFISIFMFLLANFLLLSCSEQSEPKIVANKQVPVLSSANTPERNIEHIKNQGKLNGNTYQNKYFGFSLSKPSSWAAQDTKAREKKLTLGGKEATAKVSQLRYINLFSFSKYPLGIRDKINPNVMGVAEDISFFPTMKTPLDYINNVKRMLGMSKIKYRVDKETKSRKISGLDFESMKVYTSINDVEIEQEYFVTIKHGFAIAFILTYTDSESKKVTEGIFNGVSFK